MTQHYYWQTEAPVPMPLHKGQAERLTRLEERFKELESEGVFVKTLSVYVDGVEYEFRRTEIYGDLGRWTGSGACTP